MWTSSRISCSFHILLSPEHILYEYRRTLYYECLVSSGLGNQGCNQVLCILGWENLQGWENLLGVEESFRVGDSFRGGRIFQGWEILSGVGESFKGGRIFQGWENLSGMGEPLNTTPVFICEYTTKLQTTLSSFIARSSRYWLLPVQ